MEAVQAAAVVVVEGGSRAHELLSLSQRGMSRGPVGGSMERAVKEEIGEASQVLRERYVGWGGGVLSLLTFCLSLTLRK